MKKIYPFSLCILFILCSIYVTAQQLAPSVIWAKCFGGSQDDKANTIIRTPDNGFLLVGTSKSNDGDVSGHHGSVDTTDGWVVKISSAGTIDWQKSLGGTGPDVLNTAIATNDGGYLCMGTTSSINGDVTGYHTSYPGAIDIWLVKLSRYGAILWTKCLGGTGSDIGKSIKQTSDGGYILAGSTNTADGDAAGNSISGTSAWVIKLNASGNIQWNKCYQPAGGLSTGYDIQSLSNGGYVVGIGGDSGGIFPLAGQSPIAYRLRIDDTGKVISVSRGSSQSNTLIVKPLRNGNYMVLLNQSTCYPVNTSANISISTIDTSLSPVVGIPAVIFSNCFSYGLDYTGYLVGGPGSLAQLNDGVSIVCAGTIDTIGLNHHGTYPTSDGFLSAFSLSDAVAWKKLYGGSGNDNFQSIAIENDYAFAVAGYTNSNNGDVSGNHGGYDFWMVRFGQVNFIKGAVFVDYNANGIKDPGEPFANNILVQSSKDTTRAANSTYNGFFINSVDTGTYITRVMSSLPNYTVSPVSRSSVFSSYNNTDSLQAFALQPIPGKRDYAVRFYSLNAVRPGFNITYKIEYSNVGTDTLANRTIKLVKDHRLQYLSAAPVATSISGDTISWTIASLSPRDTGSITIQLKAAAPPTLNILDTTFSTVTIDTTGDLDIANNTGFVRQWALNSYDPNDKQESNGGYMSLADATSSKGLLYTIRFQNTGNDTAFTVIVKDTLDSKVDSSTLEMVGASHPYQLTIKNGRYCTWTFNNILLPDSNRNEPASHGYIAYRIKPKAGITTGDSIKNSASIYFDFNLPVKTNTHTTFIKLPILIDLPIVNGFINNYCSSVTTQKEKILNIPAALYNATVTAKLDNTTTLTIGADSSFTITPSSLAAGNHKVDVTYSNSSSIKTLTINFSITAVSTPDVNVSANITTIINLTDNVVVTAANASGGGATPKYTFAKDRLFVTILQAEGSSNTLTQTPTSFTVGDNWVYVKMKTSDTCYTAQTNVDSIKIVRSSVTGITDVDFPQQLINIYPNPFRQQFLITGLNITKTYLVTLYNIYGQQVFQQQVKQQQTLLVNHINTATGIYLLRIDDVKKQRLIGTAKLVNGE